MAAMPSTEVRNRARAALQRKSEQELVAIIENLQAEHAALKTAFNVVVAKLNLDAGVTDVNYIPAP